MEGASVKMHFQLILSLTIVSAKADFFDDCVLLMQFLRIMQWSNIFGITCALHSRELLFSMNQGKIYVSISIFEKAVL